MSNQRGKILITGVTALVRGDKNIAPGVTVLTGDLLDRESLIPAVEGISAIIHLAAIFRTQDTDLIWKSNYEGTRNLIAVAKAHAPGSRFILASTSHVYDMNNPHPRREDDVVEPQHAYPASKVP